MALIGCVTAPRAYSEQELGAVTRRCGLALGEVMQEPDEVRLLYLYSAAAGPREIRCVRRWTHRHGLHFVHIEIAEETAQ